MKQDNDIPIIEETGDPKRCLIRKEDGTLVTSEVYYEELFKEGKIPVNPVEGKKKFKISFDL